MPLMLPQHRLGGFRQAVDLEERQVSVGQTLQIQCPVAAAQRIGTHDRAVAAGPYDLETRAAGDSPGIELIVLAQTQALVVAQAVAFEKGPADDRLEEAKFATPDA